MANTYNYFEAVKADVEQWIEDNMDLEHDIMTGTFEDRDDIETYLNDTLWTEDSITGNASGSYTFNTYEAEENICHNLDLLAEACEEFGADAGEVLKKGAENADVTIRCYLLGQAIAEVLDEIQDDIDEAIEARDEAADAEEIA